MHSRSGDPHDRRNQRPVSGRHPSRKVRSAFHESILATMVRETTAADAPVVMRCRIVDREDRFDVRMFDGLLYQRHSFEGGTVVTTADLAGMEIKDFTIDTHLDGQKDGAARGRREWLAPGGRIETSHEDLVARLAQDWSDEELLLVDGILHVRVRSPLIDIMDMFTAYGPKTIAKIVDTRFVPAWFPSEVGAADLLRDLEKEIPVREGDASDLRAQLDVEIVDADLYAECLERSAVHIVMKDRIASCVDERRAERQIQSGDRFRPHAFHFSDRLAAHAAEAAIALSGRGRFEDAAAAMDAVVLAPSESAPDHREILDPIPPDAKFRTIRLGYLMGEPGNQSWNQRKTIKTEVAVDVSSVDPHEAELVFTAGTDEIRKGPHGFLLFGDGFRMRSRIGSDGRRILSRGYAPEMIGRTIGLSERLAKSIHAATDDCFGRALRRPSAVPPLIDPVDRKTVLTEFARHRIVDVGGQAAMRIPEPLIVVGPSPKPMLALMMSHLLTAVPGLEPPILFRADRLDEACAFADEHGFPDKRGVSRIEIADASHLVFDTALWNLRASLCRIVFHVDERIRFFPPEFVAGIGRIARHLEDWTRDAGLVASEDSVARFVSDAETFVGELSDPLLDDVGVEWARTLATASMIEVLASRAGMDDEAVEEDAWLGMAM
jgi:hypothetical protein